MGKFTWDHVKIILGFTLIFIVFAPLIPFVRENAVFVSVVFVSLMGAVAFFFQSKLDVIIASIIVLAFVIARLIFPHVSQPILLLRTAAFLAFIFLHFTLLIGPWSRFTRYVLKFYKYRRHFGVAAFLLAFLHVSFVMNIYFQYSSQNAYQSAFIFFGSSALLILSVLAITSWDYVQKHVRNRVWSFVHSVVFLFYLLLLAYFLRLFRGELELWQMILIVSFLVFWLFVAPWSLPRKILVVVSGWKQLHVLIYIAYISVVVHAWTSGTVQQQPPFVQYLFWFAVLTVVGSHSVGWMIMVKQFFVRRRQRYESILVNGKKYYRLGALHSFVSGQGKRFDVEGVPLAVFLHQGKVVAFSNICGHQKGPIFQGEIVNGYVECPWHKYQFSVEDGCGPPPFSDCIPFYPVFVRSNFVYLCLEPVRPVKLFP